MIYKVIEDKKWEYRTQLIGIYDINHNQMDSYLDGGEGWECFAVIPEGDRYRFFMKRPYVEKEVKDEDDE